MTQESSTPWYKSDVLRGILIATATQLIAHSKIANMVSNDQIGGMVNWLMEGISAGAAYWAVHSRITKPTLPITGTKLAKATDNAIATADLPTPVVVPDPVPVMVTDNDSTVTAVTTNKH